MRTENDFAKPLGVAQTSARNTMSDRGDPFISDDLLLATVSAMISWAITLGLRAAFGS
jgi:hypothetical protein